MEPFVSLFDKAESPCWEEENLRLEGQVRAGLGEPWMPSFSHLPVT